MEKNQQALKSFPLFKDLLGLLLIKKKMAAITESLESEHFLQNVPGSDFKAAELLSRRESCLLVSYHLNASDSSLRLTFSPSLQYVFHYFASLIPHSLHAFHPLLLHPQFLISFYTCLPLSIFSSLIIINCILKSTISFLYHQCAFILFHNCTPHIHLLHSIFLHSYLSVLYLHKEMFCYSLSRCLSFDLQLE